MNESRLPDLKRTARQVVRDARTPGGSLDKNEFTMGIARRQVADKMGLGEDGLDGSQWKKTVKELVMEYLDEPDEENEAGPSRSASPPKKPKVKKSKESSTSAEKQSRTSTPMSPRAEIGDDVERVAEKADAGDESDMSSVYDIPPPKRRKKSASASDSRDRKVSAPDKKPKKKDASEEISPDEAKVTELKRIVVACGVRKQWAKEFADYPTTSSQIRRLRGILADLGMKGNPTMGKAKSLKEKRELAAELDDVREFEAKRGVSTGDDRRASRSANKRDISSDLNNTVDESDDADEASPVEKERSALDSVMDFLGDQSD